MASRVEPAPRMIAPAPVTRVGTPRRAAILTALAAAAVQEGSLSAVLTLARTGRPRSLITCPHRVRWLALAGLMKLYPEASGAALQAALGCRTDSRDPKRRMERKYARLADDQVLAVAYGIERHEDHHLTALWIWPTACAVTAAHTGADPEAVKRPSGSRASPPVAVSWARQLAVYLTMTEGDVNATAMSTAAGLDKKTVRHAVAKVENRRDDDPKLDDLIEDLAAELRRRLDAELSEW
jgi:hypothetical protein